MRRDDADPSVKLKARYRLALGVLAVLSVLSVSATVFIVLASAGRGTEINVAGWQRTLSKQVAIEAERGEYEALARTLSEFAEAQRSLRYGDRDRGLSGKKSTEVRAMYADVQPEFQNLVGAARMLLDEPGSVAALLAVREYQAQFLPKMNAIVHRLDHEARTMERTFVVAQLVVLALTMATILATSRFIFRPVVRRLTRQWTALLDSELRFQLAVDGSRDAIWDWNLESNSVYLAPAWAEMFDDDDLGGVHKPDAWLGLIASGDIQRFHEALLAVKDGDTDRLDVELEMRTRDDRVVSVLCRGAVHRGGDGRALRLAGSLADVTEIQKVRDELRLLAERDGLTGLLNRSMFRDAVDAAVRRYHDDDTKSFAVLYLDFDGFKAVNDALGHTVGDDLLKSIGRRLARVLPDDAVASRLGGDEFAAMLLGFSADEVFAAATAMLESFSEPHTLGQHSVVSTASIGIVFGGTAHASAEEVLRDADAAMYAAKSSGKAQYRVFDAEMVSTALTRLHLETQLQQAKPAESFEVQYQPLVYLDSGEVEGFEALIRWPDAAERGIGPEEFIPVAEEVGAIVPIGRWVLNESARALLAFDREVGHERLIMHVNVSKRQLLQPDFRDDLRALQIAFPSLAGRIVLEVTETAVMDTRANVVPRMREARDLGFPLAMDDFGTGHSSLGCLHHFPLDVLKIDRSFIVDIESRREFSAVYHSIVSLANNLNLRVVSEGIESSGQLAQMQALGAMIGQGHLFGGAMSRDDATRYLLDGTPRRAA